MKRGLVVIGAALTLTACSGGIGPGDAYRSCERAVETQLVSPGTAEFSGATGSDIAEADGLFTVVGHVDSQNSFGASLRSNFTCQVRETADNNLELVDLDVS